MTTPRENWRPGASRHVIETRAHLLADIRSFFAERGVLEVETALISPTGNVDPNIESIVTADDRYLRTSPEFMLKRLLAAGLRDIYEMGRVFRAGEAGRNHNPEFTMLEWYRTGMTYLDLADEVAELVRACGRGRFNGWPVKRIPYRELFRRETGLDPLLCGETELEDCAAERGVRTGPLDRQEWIDLLLAEVVQPALPGEQLTVVYDYPPEQAALARIRPGDVDMAERFELYLGQAELANGYQELTDPVEQLARFERDARQRERRGQERIPIDLRLVAALQAGLPECSGVALGVDRLLMAILKLDRIDAVLAFSTDRA
ncbi:MAG: EF-P lysine aminoacylase EpmA [Xanthomonadales bacterium]